MTLPVRMSPADAVWLGVDAPNNHMAVTAVLQLSGRLSLEQLTRLVEERMVQRYPAFSRRVQRSIIPLLPPSWHDDPGFDVARHVVQEAGPPLDQTALRRLAGALMSRPRERVRIAGLALDEVVFWVPQVGRIGLGVSIFSYADRVTIGIAADALLDVDPDLLVGQIAAEFAVLRRDRP